MPLTKLEAFLIEEDALANHFELTIPNFPAVLDIAGTILRVKTIDIPDTEVYTYEVTKGGKKATRIGGIQATANEFSLTYTIDKRFTVYDGFERWVQLCFSDTLGAKILPEKDLRIDLLVVPKDANGVIRSGGWKLRGCFPSSHGGIAFDEESGDPLEGTITFQFIDKNPIGALEATTGVGLV